MLKKSLLVLMVAGTIVTSMNFTSVANAAEQNSSVTSSYKAAQETVTGMIIANNVNLRSGRGTSYSSYGQVNYGDTCEVLRVYDGSVDELWAKVKMTSGANKGKTGYVLHDYLIYT